MCSVRLLRLVIFVLGLSVLHVHKIQVLGHVDRVVNKIF